MMKANYYPFDLIRRANALYQSSYQPTKTPIIKTSENLYQDVVNEKAQAVLTNSLPNSISKAIVSADNARRLDTRA